MDKIILSLAAAIATVGGMFLIGLIISEILTHYSVWVVIGIIVFLGFWTVWFLTIDE